jgi:hypothetical protein
MPKFSPRFLEMYVLIMTYLCMVGRHSGIEGWYMVGYR